jgi:primosomal protein N' (replication factor Y) (superfamily II helicase)
VIGTRSAVFSPLSNLGLIVLDEEHDSSFKQDRPAPTYHAREVADWRAQAVNCPLILGSATPSLISWVGTREIEAFHQHYLSLPKRVENRPLPHIEIVDMRQELQSGNRTIFGRTLTKSLQTLKERQQQGILFVHRRGHSTFVSCRNCGFVMECPHCDVSLAYHQTNGLDSALMRCHYCNYCTTQPRHCPECNSPYFKYFGSGTQKVAQELQTHFPQLTYLRFDSDTTSRKGAHREILEKFARREADILIGTQILAKGLDLPQVTFVGVIAADALLHFSDYQAAERGFQTLTQVSGRSGRGKEPGSVVIQTYTPEHPVIQAVAKHDYPGFVSRELTDRQELNYPPYGRLVLFRLNSLNELAVERESRRLSDRLQTEADKYNYTILGPSPAVVPRVADRFRWQIMLKFPTDATFPDFSHFRQQEESGVNISIDIDPLNFH